MPDLRFGSVPYVNARPLIEGLPVHVVEVPSRLAERFRAGEVDVALLSSFEALRDRRRAVVPGIAVASGGPVGSVLLFRRGPRSRLDRVLLDESSLTSAALLKVLLPPGTVYEDCPADIDPRSTGDAGVLLIGDAALRAPRDGLETDDLATLWRERTGLPFVFAVWLARDEETARRAEPVLTAAKARGLARRGEIARRAARETGLSESKLREYLADRIAYDLGEEEQRGLEAFGDLCRERGVL